MRYGRALLAGLGWAGTLGGLALCVLIFLSTYLAFDDHGADVRPRKDEILRLPSVPEAEVPRVPLGRAPAGATPPIAANPSPAATSPPAGSGRPQPPPTLGDTTREVVGAVGTEVGRVSPPAAQVVENAGDALGDTVDALKVPAPPGR